MDRKRGLRSGVVAGGAWREMMNVMNYFRDLGGHSEDGKPAWGGRWVRSRAREDEIARDRRIGVELCVCLHLRVFLPVVPSVLCFALEALDSLAGA